MASLVLGKRNSQSFLEISSGLPAPKNFHDIIEVLEAKPTEKTGQDRLLRVFALLQLFSETNSHEKPKISEINCLAWSIGQGCLSELRTTDVAEGTKTIEHKALTAEAGLACLHHIVLQLDCALKEEILVYATAYTDTVDPWTTEEASLLADALMQKCLPGDKTERYIVDWILPQWLRPIFSRATSKVTQSGRPSHFLEQAPRDFEALERPAWKMEGLQVISTARWAAKASSEELIRNNWPLFTPVLLTLSEDEDTKVRILGLEIVVNFLEKCPAKVLKSTGIGKVFEDATLPSVLYLPSLTPEEDSVKIMRPAYEALLVLAQKDTDASSPARRELLDRVLRDGLLAAYEHASNYLVVVEVLMSTAVTLLDKLGIYSVKHLPNLFSTISSILTDPFTASHPSVLLQATRALNAVLVNCWPRIVEGGYEGEVTRIIATCWLNVRDGTPGVPSPQTTLAELECELQHTQAMLRSLQEASGAKPPAEAEQILKQEPKLKELFSST